LGVERRELKLVISRYLLAGATSIVLVGCGSSTPVPPVSGAAVFAAHCSACHSLSRSATPRQQGGDLGGFRLPYRELLQYAVEMPRIHGAMSTRELRAVAAYVLATERR
jgi:hypothetical protein